MPSDPETTPIVCTLDPEQLNARRDVLLPGLLARADERTPLAQGYRLTYTTRPGLLEEIAGVVAQERECCRFLKFTISLEPSNGPIIVEVTGPPGTREMLDAL